MTELAKGGETPYLVDFATNDGLDALVKAIEKGTEQTEWDKVIQQAVRIVPSARDYPIDIPRLLVATYLMQQFDEQAIKKTPIVLNAIPDKTATKDYTFTSSKPYGTVLPLNDSSAQQQNPSEHTLVTKIDGLPTLWLLSLTDGLGPERRTRRLFGADNLNQRFRPLQGYYQGKKEFGCVVVTLPDTTHSSVDSFIPFTKHGGKHLPLFSPDILAEQVSAFYKIRNRKRTT